MPSEEHPNETDKVPRFAQEDPYETYEVTTALRPSPNLSSSSGNTEESLSVYADQTLRPLKALDPSLDNQFPARS